ncbi:MAG: shikimate dehydrogenase [Xanthomonadales bacterium]|nr:shikimate dehydrogenase [Xanthomonadales bacterium]
MEALHLALFGNPVAHSLSPAIHQAFADQCGLKLDYELILATEENFSEQLEQLRSSGARGCNITVPLKVPAHNIADTLSTAAATAGAANTLVFQQHGVFADNTDGLGWLKDLDRTDTSIKGKSVAIIGAGGAAAGITPVILAQSPDTLVIANRSPEKAADLLRQQLNPNFRSVSLKQLHQPDLPKFDLLVNATSIGHQGKHPELFPELFNPDALLYDLNYGTAAEPLKTWCNNNGIRYRDGLGMLVEQAALAFTLWTGKSPETQAVLSDLRSKLRQKN